MPKFLTTLVVILFAFNLAPAAAQVPFWEGNVTKIKVCTSEYTPMVYCSDREADAFDGYEIELFKKVYRVLGWTDDMLEWTCMDWDSMVESLATNDGQCDMAVAGVEANPDNVAAGIVFTRPSYRNGLTVMVKTSEQTSGTWAFWDAFEWQVWLAAVLTALAITFIVYAIDLFYYPAASRHGEVDPLHIPTMDEAANRATLDRQLEFQRYFWEPLTRPMMPRDLYAMTFAGNLVYLGWGFLVLILYTLYLGNTAANLTILNLSTGGIKGVETLPGKAVATWDAYQDKLKPYSVAAVGYPWDTVADEEAMFEALQSGTVKALVLDAPLLNYVAATDCTVAVVGETFEEFEQGTAFPAGFNNTELLARFDEILVQLGEDGEIENLENSYITPPASECGELYSAKVTLSQVAGLWIILAICIGVALIWALVVRMSNKHYVLENAKHYSQAHSATVERAASDVKGAVDATN